MKTKTFFFEIHCFCRLPTNGKEKMVRCDICKTWFHKDCLAKNGLNFDILSCKNSANVLWACPNGPSKIEKSDQQIRTVKPKTAKNPAMIVSFLSFWSLKICDVFMFTRPVTLTDFLGLIFVLNWHLLMATFYTVRKITTKKDKDN